MKDLAEDVLAEFAEQSRTEFLGDGYQFKFLAKAEKDYSQFTLEQLVAEVSDEVAEYEAILARRSRETKGAIGSEVRVRMLISVRETLGDVPRMHLRRAMRGGVANTWFNKAYQQAQKLRPELFRSVGCSPWTREEDALVLRFEALPNRTLYACAFRRKVLRKSLGLPIAPRKIVKTANVRWTPAEDEMALSRVVPPGRTLDATDKRRSRLRNNAETGSRCQRLEAAE